MIHSVVVVPLVTSRHFTRSYGPRSSGISRTFCRFLSDLLKIWSRQGSFRFAPFFGSEFMQNLRFESRVGGIMPLESKHHSPKPSKSYEETAKTPALSKPQRRDSPWSCSVRATPATKRGERQQLGPNFHVEGETARRVLAERRRRRRDHSSA